MTVRPAIVVTHLNVSGMSCASCAGRVEHALAAVPGVRRAAVNLATRSARVEWDAGASPDVGRLVRSVEALGYSAEPLGAAGDLVDVDAAEMGRSLRAVWIAAVFTVPIFLIEMGGHLVPGLHHWMSGHLGNSRNWLLFLLATVVQFGPGLQFYKTGTNAIQRWNPDMNSLVMLGISAAYFYSVAATFFPAAFPTGAAHVYFEASAVIVTLVLLGRHFEAVARGRTGHALRGLLALQAPTAIVVRDGHDDEVDVQDVRVGDLVRVLPGGRLPVDGVVADGVSYVDEAMVTGEPMPVEKSPGSGVIAGTINQRGSLVVRATGTGADTLLSRIVRMVAEAQGAKLPVQAVVDRVTAVFVQGVLGVALIAFLGWLWFGPAPSLPFAVVAAVSVLIIACPCAMGLATPTSILVASGQAAGLGILFRNGASIQVLREVTRVAIDKTGTLTEGRPSVVRLSVEDGWSRDEVLALAAGVERNSEHPVAEAIVRFAHDSGLAPRTAVAFAALPGQGAHAVCDGRLVMVGSVRWMEELGILFRSGDEPFALGHSIVCISVDRRPVARLAIADPVKISAKDAVRQLRETGREVIMVTGDQEATARAVAEAIGMDRVIADVMPDEKASAVQSLQADGSRVAFVGDGINDAPALAQADVGIALGTGTEIAIETADVVILSGDPRAVVDAMDLSAATMRNIRQNLFFAFVYNAVLIPLAAGAAYPFFGILLSPALAAAAMAASSVCVVGNALRLRRFRPARN